MTDYLDHMKKLFDCMEIAGKPVTEDELIDTVLCSVEEHKFYEQISLQLEVL
jgi:hypothetical protein